jgi:hypothetical protein
MRKRMGAIALATALAFGIQGCYGSFALTRKLWKWNGSMGNKFVNELVFLVCTFLPVYGIAGFIDGIVLNSVEFWTGKNPMYSKVMVEGDKMVKMEGQKDGKMQVAVFYKGQLQDKFLLAKQDGGVVATDLSGKLLAQAGTGDLAVAQ